MRICVVAPDTPFPPNRGGRVDVLRRILGFRELGHDVMLVSASLSAVGENNEAAKVFFHDHNINWVTLGFDSHLKQICRAVSSLGRRPIFIARRTPSTQDWIRVLKQAKEFRPNLLWTEGPWLWDLAASLRESTGAPLAYRSHNIEHIYMRKQATLTSSPSKRMAMFISYAGLERFERYAIEKSDFVFDISIEDMEWWRTSHSIWLPPLIDQAGLRSSRALPAREREILFVGNLGTPNNLDGVRWFCREIFPIIRSKLPDATLRVVGSTSDPNIQEELIGYGAALSLNVTNVFDWMRSASVLINPVRYGSGVQLKMIDMLMTERPIVSTSQGVRGLPRFTVKSIKIADDTTGFASAVVSAIYSPDSLLEGRAKSREAFTVSGLEQALRRVSQQ